MIRIRLDFSPEAIIKDFAGLIQLIVPLPDEKLYVCSVKQRREVLCGISQPNFANVIISLCSFYLL